MARRCILAPTDFSETGDAAVACAFALAEPAGSVHLLHVIDRAGTPNPLYAHYAPGRTPNAEERAREAAALRDRLDALVPAELRARGVRVELHVTEASDACGAICEAAERVDADLVVVGSQGRGGILRLLVGSVTEGVLRHARRDVIVVRPAHA
jgi:nucleotide-binding universal stress UspA family protein